MNQIQVANRFPAGAGCGGYTILNVGIFQDGENFEIRYALDFGEKQIIKVVYINPRGSSFKFFAIDPDGTDEIQVDNRYYKVRA